MIGVWVMNRGKRLLACVIKIFVDKKRTQQNISKKRREGKYLGSAELCRTCRKSFD